MELTKHNNELTEEVLDETDAELLTDEEIEEGIQRFKSMFTPEELDEMFAPRIDEEYIEAVHWEPSERHKKFMEELLQRPYDDIVRKK